MPHSSLVGLGGAFSFLGKKEQVTSVATARGRRLSRTHLHHRLPEEENYSDDRYQAEDDSAGQDGCGQSFLFGCWWGDAQVVGINAVEDAQDQSALGREAAIISSWIAVLHGQDDRTAVLVGCATGAQANLPARCLQACAALGSWNGARDLE